MSNRLKELRKEKGVSQKYVADFLGLTKQAVQRYESGLSTPKLETWQKLAEFFDVSVLKLIGDDEQPEVELKNDVPTEVIYKGKKYKVITNE
ncbi:helix-turn-helix transcriptional regulator [Fructobacillus americanaquae]|uniref:Helix-turn-helix domain-containing protein n=1 Tax=Fructobacillus americanaquae TaxID=2940302 RepID=A0ABY5C086_9LACO|nr:helix-turn-helix transcriptional regulator [Fructobacillus americanaquae]USS92007.1 helix-turn-helix domain-containing protein [Fructobacillus americanaquae]